MFHYIDQKTKTVYVFLTMEGFQVVFPDLVSKTIKKDTLKSKIDCPEIQAHWDEIVSVETATYTNEKEISFDVVASYTIPTEFKTI